MTGIACKSCGSENPDSANFCIDCGVRLGRVCAACGIESPLRARFCANCGSALLDVATHAVTVARSAAAPEVAASSPPTLRPAAPTERRQITVLFCDIVGSTALSERLDPEDLHGLLTAYQDVSSAVIRRFDGYLAKYLGDGLLVFFGYPNAHEDAVERAVRTAIEMRKAIAHLAESVQTRWGITLAARIGVHTGLVVAGEMGADDRRVMDIVGETPNIAARLQEKAVPNTVVLSGATHRLIAHAFHCHSLGEHTLKGLSRPLELFEALAERDDADPDTDSITPDAPLVGRERELRHLLNRWQQAEASQSQLVMLTGEAGIGKSRLTHALRAHVAMQPGCFITEIKCAPYHQSSPFYPIIQTLQNDVFKFKREDTLEDRQRKLEAFLLDRNFVVAETMPYMALLMSLPPSPNYPMPHLSAEGQRQKTLEILLRIVLKRAAQQPFLMIVENIHWADPSTLELLRLLAEQVHQDADVRLLLLMTFRPTFAPPYGSHPNMLLLTLERLDDSYVKSIIERIGGKRALPPEVIRQIIAKTDGIPLFVEELTKMVLESGALVEQPEQYALAGPLRELDVPTTLNDSLMARLDRLSSVKEIAQIASVIGREFTFELLTAICELDQDLLRTDLRRLVAAELLHELRDVDGVRIYRFKHALIQDAAYKSLLISRRQQFHRHIADVLIARFPETAANQPELLAGHYTAAGNIEQALVYWNRAGQRALTRSANQEAIIHFSKSLELLESHPDTPAALQQELFARANLGIALISTQGFAAPEVGKVFSRAQELCDLCGDSPEIVPVLVGFSGFSLVSAEFHKARAQAEHLLQLAEQWNHHGLHVIGRYSLGNPLMWMGDLAEARRILEEARQLYDVTQHPHYTAIYTQDPGVSTLCFLELLLWHQGYADQAEVRGQEALALANQTAHLFSQAWALNCAALLYHWRRDYVNAERFGDRCVAHCAEQNYPFFLAAGMIYGGWGRFWQGRREEGLAGIRQGLAIYQATGSRVCQPFLLALLGEALDESGEWEEGLAVLEQGIAFAQLTGERISEPDLHRLKGRLLLKHVPNQRAEAESCLLHAAEMAVEMNAKSRQLQAETDLCRLWAQDGKRDAARARLAPIVAWFTEGFATPDYQEARALLDAL